MAFPLSPPKPSPPFPATVVITPLDTFADTTVAKVCNEEIAITINSYAGGIGQLAFVAAPSSPLKPGVPFPAPGPFAYCKWVIPKRVRMYVISH